MPVREMMQKQKGVGVAVGVVMIVVAVIAIAAQTRSDGPSRDPTKAYFSDDDGQTYFVDSAEKIAPFNHNGKTAVRAYVYDDGKHPFVAFLQRFKPQTAKILQATADDVKAGKATAQQLDQQLGSREMQRAGSEVKLPGSGGPWTSGDRFDMNSVKAVNSVNVTEVNP
jgi:hypothetical protein